MLMTNPRIHELIAYLDAERAELDRAIASVPAAKHHVKPSPEAYSVVEVVNHLAITDRRVTALLTKVAGDARGNGATPDHDIAPILPTIDVRRVLDRSSKIRNPRADPPADCTLADGLTALDAARSDLKALMQKQDLPSLGGVTAPHPAFGPMTGYEWIAFMAAHTRRHADQIREIGTSLSS
jgi:hypothetical protein